MRNCVLFFLLLGAAGCSFKPVPVKLSELAGKQYLRVSNVDMAFGPYRGEGTTIVQYDAVFRILTDDAGKSVRLRGDLAALNYFAPLGWRFVDRERVTISRDFKRDFFLLERLGVGTERPK
jgi:hypothetical protein